MVNEGMFSAQLFLADWLMFCPTTMCQVVAKLAPMHNLYPCGMIWPQCTLCTHWAHLSARYLFWISILHCWHSLALRNLNVLISTCLEIRYQLAKIQLAQFFSTVLNSISTCLETAADSKSTAHSSENCFRSVSTVLIAAARQISAARPKSQFSHLFLSHALGLTSNKYYFEV